MREKGISWDEGALLMRLLMSVDWDSGIVVTSFSDPFKKETVFIPATSKEVMKIAGRSRSTVLKLLRSLREKGIIERVSLGANRVGIRIRPSICMSALSEDWWRLGLKSRPNRGGFGQIKSKI